MKKKLLRRLICPNTRQELKLEEKTLGKNKEDVITGFLVSKNNKYQYPIINGIPRFVPSSNYADNFSFQWNEFAKTQLDSHSGQPISAERFWKATGWKSNDIKGQWVLDLGCGSGRFTEIALQAGANVVSIDYSSAVDACVENLNHYSNLHVVQCDINNLPFQKESFIYVFSLGVLQHTPNVSKSFIASALMTKPGGYFCADFYWNRLITMINMKYLLRPLTKNIDQKKLFLFLKRHIKLFLYISQLLGKIPFIGIVLKKIIPVVNYDGIYNLSKQQLEEWALLDTFDMLAPKYDNPQSAETIKKWFYQNDFENVKVFHEGHLVGRGIKKIRH